MKLETALHAVHSLNGRKTIGRNALFGAIARLRAAVVTFEGINNSVSILTEKGYNLRAEAIRASSRYTSLEAAMEVAASHAAGVYGIISSMFDVTPEFEPPVPKHLSKEEISQLSDFSGMSEKDVASIRNTADSKRFAKETEAQSMAEAMFWAANPEEDPDVKADMVLRALIQTQKFITTWSTPDFAELGILKADIAAIDKIAAQEMDKEEGEGALGINEDGTSRASQYQQQEEISE